MCVCAALNSFHVMSGCRPHGFRMVSVDILNTLQHTAHCNTL